MQQFSRMKHHETIQMITLASKSSNYIFSLWEQKSGASYKHLHVCESRHWQHRTTIPR